MNLREIGDLVRSKMGPAAGKHTETMLSQGRQRIVSAAVQAFGIVEAYQKVRPVNVVNIGDTSISKNAGEQHTFKGAIPKGFQFTRAVFDKKDAENWMLVQLKYNSFTTCIGNTPGPLDALAVELASQDALAPYVLRESDDKIEVELTLEAKNNASVFHGLAILGFDSDQSCSLTNHTRPSSKAQHSGLAALMPQLSETIMAITDGFKVPR